MPGGSTKPAAMSHLLARLRTLSRDRSAATIIEFAAVAAPFIALLIATLQTSLVFFAQQSLETVSEDLSRQILTGAVRNSNTSRDDFQQAACNTLRKDAPYMSCANLMVDVQTADSFADIDTSTPSIYDKDGNPKTWQFNTGTAGSIVVMRTMYLLPVIGGPLGFNLANTDGSRRLLVATAVFQTEPYLT